MHLLESQVASHTFRFDRQMSVYHDFYFQNSFFVFSTSVDRTLNIGTMLNLCSDCNAFVI